MWKDKDSLRREMRALRDGAPDRALCDAKLFQNFFSLPQVQEADSFFVYYSFGSEADTHALIARILSEGKRVCLPRVEGREMVFVPYFGQALERGRFGIGQPQGEEADFPPDVVVLPMLAWNGLYRLGYGGGYYDRFLEKTAHTCKIGLAYAFQRTDVPFMQAHDIPADILVTDEKIYFTGNTEDSE